ncbi:MAG: hypothetical protein F6J87_18260 [Spirulina sp. SIO3F2]|nr:hypothetical protein [Spirulina sp. SIO3F2]
MTPSAPRAEIRITLQQLGLPLLPVAPEFPASEYPHPKNPNKPRFTGKNPSYLTSPRNPKIVNHRQYHETIPADAELARWFQHPDTGFGTKPGFKVGDRYFLAIDLDRKHFESQADCDAALAEIWSRCPTLAETRIEQTRSGGYHLWCWSAKKPGFVNWALDPNGPQLGEILGGKAEPAFMVIAPTNGYNLVNDGDLAEITDWSFLHPTGKPGPATSPPLPAAQPQVVGLPDITAFFSPTAAAYYNDVATPDDRSEAITTVLNECQGWVNWLAEHNIQYNGDLMAVASFMARKYDAEDKILRILQTIDSDVTPACTLRGGDESAWKKVRKVAPGQAPKPNNVVQLHRRVKPSAPTSESQTADSDPPLEQPKPYHYNSLTQLMEIISEEFPQLWWDEFEQSPKFDEQTSPYDTEPGQLRMKIAAEVGIKAPKEDIADAVVYIARQNRRNPIVEYLKDCYALYGANSELLADLGDRYFGSGGISNTFVRKTLIAAVARAMEPGCKQETMLILQDPREGTRKTDFFQTLVPDSYFDNSMQLDGGGKYEDQVMHLHRCWLEEMGEFERIWKRKEANFLSHFLSIQADTLRRPYMRNLETLPRPSILVGTTNRDDFIIEAGRNRRFWIVPVQIEKIPVEQLAVERDRLWAAAYAEYQGWVERGRNNAECPWWLSDDERKDAAAVAAEFTRRDPWHDAIAAFVQFRQEVTVSEILTECIEQDLARQDGYQASRVAEVLRQLGWKSHRLRRGDKRPTVWLPPKLDHPVQPGSPALSEQVIQPNSSAHQPSSPPGSPGHPQNAQNFPGSLCPHNNSDRKVLKEKGVIQVIQPPESQVGEASEVDRVLEVTSRPPLGQGVPPQQKTLATYQGKDSDLWQLRLFAGQQVEVVGRRGDMVQILKPGWLVAQDVPLGDLEFHPPP